MSHIHYIYRIISDINLFDICKEVKWKSEDERMKEIKRIENFLKNALKALLKNLLCDVYSRR